MNKRQADAKRSLEFYAFWLWHYIAPPYGDFGTFAEFVKNKKSAILAQCKFRRCRSKSEKCKSCELLNSYSQYDFLGKIFVSWFEGISPLPENKIRLRMSSADILKATYENDGEFFSSTLRLHINLIPTTFDGLNIEKRKNEIGYLHKYTAKPTIKLDAPACIISSDLLRIKAYTEFLESLGNKHSVVAYKKFMQSKETLHIDFIGVLSELRNFNRCSFKPSAHNTRVLGFWLWEQIDLLKRFKTLPDAINELKSDMHCPQELHAKMGIGARDNLQNLYHSTKICIEKSEVMKMR